MTFFDVEKFKLVEVTGKTTQKVYKQKRVGPFWNRREEQVLSHTVEDEFELTDIEHSHIPPKAECSEYQWKYAGKLEIVNIYYFLQEQRFRDSPEPCVHIAFAGHRGVTISAECVGFSLTGEAATPIADITFHELGGKGKTEGQGWIDINAIFASRAQLDEYTKSLEPEDTVILAKLKRA